MNCFVLAFFFFNSAIVVSNFSRSSSFSCSCACSFALRYNSFSAFFYPCDTYTWNRQNELVAGCSIWCVTGISDNCPSQWLLIASLTRRTALTVSCSRPTRSGVTTFLFMENHHSSCNIRGIMRGLLAPLCQECNTFFVQQNFQHSELLPNSLLIDWLRLVDDNCGWFLVIFTNCLHLPLKTHQFITLWSLFNVKLKPAQGKYRNYTRKNTGQ